VVVPVPPEVSAHLESHYGISVASIERLDLGVGRVHRRDGPDWVARVFPEAQHAAVQGQAELLRRLEAGGFPAEHCADPEPVSRFSLGVLLVTEFVEGSRSDGKGRTYGYLGALLGRLHSHPGESLLPGGAWHHLSPTGGPRAEIDAALALLDAHPSSDRCYEELMDALAGLDDCADLPEGIVHPDFVPSNAITTTDDRRVLVDWSGAGRGPRLYSLAYMLWAAGARDLHLVDVAFTRYMRSIQLEPAEVDRLEGVIPARALTIGIWSYAHRRGRLGAVAEDLEFNRGVAARVAGRVKELLDA
jgi:Ser/Thr protein kinase RdoA (MazF antagonist)